MGGGVVPSVNAELLYIFTDLGNLDDGVRLG
jgi:hypothetical protein